MKSSRPKSSIPEIGEGTRGVDGYAVYLLRQAAGALRTGMDRALEPVGMTTPQFTVLALLNFYPGASGAELARLSQLTPQTLTVITRNLANAELIRASPVEGRRQIPYALTEQGKTLLARGKKIIGEMELEILAGFSSAETATLKRWLVEVAKR